MTIFVGWDHIGLMFLIAACSAIFGYREGQHKEATRLIKLLPSLRLDDEQYARLLLRWNPWRLGVDDEQPADSADPVDR
jgi:hypothetical protein